MTTITTVIVDITFYWDEKTPYTLAVEGPEPGERIEGEGGEVYFSEHDGTSLADVLDAIPLPEGASVERADFPGPGDRVWVSYWDADALRQFDGRTFAVRYSQIFEEVDGEWDWVEDTAELIENNEK